MNTIVLVQYAEPFSLLLIIDPFFVNTTLFILQLKQLPFLIILMPQHVSGRQYNTTQKYFLLIDSILTAFWLAVLLRLLILYPLTGARFLPGGIADFYISVLLATAIIEIVNFITVFRLIPGKQTINNGLQKPVLPYLIFTSFTRMIFSFIVYNYPKTARSEAFSILLLTQSSKEFFRWFYNLQKVRLFNTTPKFNKLSRSFTYLVCSPVEAFTTIYIILQSLGYPSYQNSLAHLDLYIKSILKGLIIIYLPIAYFIYKRTLTKYFFSSSIIQNPSKKQE